MSFRGKHTCFALQSVKEDLKTDPAEAVSV